MNRFILTGPQGIGKTHAAAHIASALGLSNVIDEWIAGQSFPDNTLAINSDGLPFISEWEDVVVIQVTSAKGMQSLIQALEQAVASTIQVA